MLISPEGILDSPTTADQKNLIDARGKALAVIESDLKQFSKLRKISLRGLNAQIAEHRRNFKELPDDVLLLAGLQQIKYVFVYPELNDIVLAGPAEGWQVSPQGDIVGLTTGRPVMHLDDLLVALRFAKAGAIQCSIDPTQKGLKQVQALVSQLGGVRNPQAAMQQIEAALGPQMITTGGVPDTSHFARTMVSADYYMKRLAMNLDASPVRGLTSYLHMAQADRSGLQNMMPRWWLAPDAAPLQTSDDGLSWDLGGIKVKCLTEEDVLQADGSKKQTGKAAGPAVKWAESFTANYDAVAQKMTIFGHLRNVIDLAVVGALVNKHGLFDKAGLDAAYLVKEEPIEQFDAPKQVGTKASVIRKGNGWLISASGGVQIQPGKLVDNAEKNDTTGQARSDAMARDNRWWWD